MKDYIPITIATGLTQFLPELMAQALPPGTEWVSLIEKAGTVGVLVWMVVWFQKRMDQSNERVVELTRTSFDSLKTLSESQGQMNKALSELAHLRAMEIRRNQETKE